MSTVIYLSNSEVRVIVGKRNGNYLCVDAAFRGNAPEGSIINGQVLNEEVFTNLSGEFLGRTQAVQKRCDAGAGQCKNRGKGGYGAATSIPENDGLSSA